MLKATLKSLLAHKLRMALTALAVVLGVGFIAGTYVLTDTMDATFEDLFSGVSQGVDVYVRAESSFESEMGGSREPIDQELLETVRAIPGVAAAEGAVSGYAQLVDKQGDAISPNGAPTLGASWSDPPLNSLTMRIGEPPTSSDSVVIDAATSEEHGFRVGDSVQLLFVGAPREFTVSGIAGFGDANNLAGATLAIFELETAQEVFDRVGEFDSIDVAAAEDISGAELRDRIASELPSGLEAVTGQSVADEQTKSVQRSLGFFNTALLVFAGIALFVGAFIIFNTFSITVAQRTREFALLRALGASGGQVMASVVIEAFVLGAIASAIGLAVGVLVAMGLESLLAGFGIDLPSSGLVLLPRTVFVSMALGVLVTVASSVVPARKAAKVSPMAALRESAPQTARWSRKRTVVGVLLTTLGAALLLLGLFGDADNPASLVGLGALIVFLGVAILTPLFAGPLALALGSPVARIDVPGKLAQQNAARNPKRTAATAAALMIGLALVGFVSIFGASVTESTNKIYEEGIKADFMLVSSSLGGSAGFSSAIAEDLVDTHELTAVAPLRVGQWRLERTKTLFVVGTDPNTFDDVADLDVKQGDLAALSDGGVLVYDKTAEDLGLEVGDELQMEFAATGIKGERVVGTFANKSVVGTDYVISLDTYDANFPDQRDSTVLVKAAPGVDPADARRVVEDAAEPFPNVEVQDQTEMKEQSAQQIDQLLGLVTALLGLALVIALLGITNTLALSVFERTRELGLMRAIGMLRTQTRTMIRWEAVLISIIGALLGIIVGLFFGWALVEALAEQGITELAIPGGRLFVYVVVAGVAGVLAAIPPARRAANLNILKAIGTE